MKKSYLLIVLAALFIALFGFAAASQASSEFTINSTFAVIESSSVNLPVAPYIDNGRTLLPVRYLAYACGVAEDDVNWNANTRTVTLKLGNNIVKLTIGSRTMNVNGVNTTIEAAPRITNGYTFLPARYVAEAFGCEVGWEAITQTVYVYPSSDSYKLKKGLTAQELAGSWQHRTTLNLNGLDCDLTLYLMFYSNGNLEYTLGYTDGELITSLSGQWYILDDNPDVTVLDLSEPDGSNSIYGAYNIHWASDSDYDISWNDDIVIDHLDGDPLIPGCEGYWLGFSNNAN